MDRIIAPSPFKTDIAIPAGRDDRALKKACREFESLLIAQMLHKMRDTVPKTDLMGSRDKEELFQSMLDDEVAGQLSNNGSLGLGDVIYAQLTLKETAKVPGESGR